MDPAAVRSAIAAVTSRCEIGMDIRHPEGPAATGIRRGCGKKLPDRHRAGSRCSIVPYPVSDKEHTTGLTTGSRISHSPRDWESRQSVHCALQGQELEERAHHHHSGKRAKRRHRAAGQEGFRHIPALGEVPLASRSISPSPIPRETTPRRSSSFLTTILVFPPRPER